MTENQRYCSTCPKPISERSFGQCRVCAARVSGKRSIRIAQETREQKQARMPTDSWWAKPAADYAEAASRMHGKNGWNL